MVSLLALRAGPNGKVIAIEPHPTVFSELQYNIEAWKQVRDLAPIVAHNLALTNFTGVAQLIVPRDFDNNCGLSYLATGDDHPNLQEAFYQVPVNTLDAVVGTEERICFLKIDVEGHELAVLKGAQSLMLTGGIRDILFEEERPVPTPVTEFLEDCGYTIYRVDCNLFAPTISPLKTPSLRVVDDAPNYLATRDSNRSIARMSKRGWMVYSSTRRQ
jgi:FkbM family methyltransferase